MLSKLSYPFWSAKDGRLRALLRIVLHAILWIILSLVVLFPTALGIGLLGNTLNLNETEP